MSHKQLCWKVIGNGSKFSETFKPSLDTGIVDYTNFKLSVTLNSWKSDLDTGLHKRVNQGLLDPPVSNSRVIKEVMGYEGGNYQKGKVLLERLKREF